MLGPILICIGSFYALCLVLLLIAMRRAPHGYESKEGFRRGLPPRPAPLLPPTANPSISSTEERTSSGSRPMPGLHDDFRTESGQAAEVRREHHLVVTLNNDRDTGRAGWALPNRSFYL